MIVFKINGEEYTVKNINNLTFDEYNDIINIINNKSENDIDKIKKLLTRITDIPQNIINIINTTSFYQVDWNDILKFDLPRHGLRKSYFIDGNEYIFEDYNKMTFGKWIDLDYLIQLKDEEEKIKLIVARLLYTPQDYNDLLDFAMKVEKMIAKDVLSIFDSFLKWRKNLVDRYEDLFVISDSNDEEDIDEFEDEEEENDDNEINYGWMDTAYYLAENILNVKKVLELNIIEVMNYLSFEKEKYDREQEELKKLKNRNQF